MADIMRLPAPLDDDLTGIAVDEDETRCLLGYALWSVIIGGGFALGVGLVFGILHVSETARSIVGWTRSSASSEPSP